MIYELERSQFDRVRGLFEPFTGWQPFCTAVVEGAHSGRVFVDQLENPRTAFLNHNDPWSYFVGDPSNQAFNCALNQAIWARAAFPENVPSLLGTCASDGWDAALKTILAPREPITARRRHYVCHAHAHKLAHERVPGGFTVQKMDASLLDRPGFVLPNEVREFIEKYRDADRPAFRDYGFVAIHEETNQVVSWTTVDAVSRGVGDVGLQTLPEYRRRGLAAITTAAALEYGLENGLSTIVWTCADDNVGSIRTTERLGLQRQKDYALHYIVFDEMQHIGVQAYYELDAGRYEQAIALFERAFALGGDGPSFLYHDAARAWAWAGDAGRALQYLNRAIDKGWTDVPATEQCREFSALRETAGWRAALERMQPHEMAH